MANFNIGDFVRVGEAGSKRYPIASRYTGRTGEIVGTARVGRTTVFQVQVHDRVSPLPVTARFLNAR